LITPPLGFGAEDIDLAIPRKRSAELFEEAQRYLPGGVNSPARAFKAVDGQPLFIKRAQGARLYDEDDNEFLDYVCSWGAIILDIPTQRSSPLSSKQ